MGRATERIAAALFDRYATVRDAWYKFWYQPEDPIGISLIRIATGAVLLYSLIIWTLDLDAFFSQRSGWQSAELVNELQRGQWTFSFWWYISDNWLWPAHFLCIAIVLAFTSGFMTRYTKFVALAISISYANRVPMAQFGLDQITNIWVLYLCFGPCGARLSVDRWLALRKARRSGDYAPTVSASSAARLSMRLVQVHLCFVYAWAGISKLQGHSWASGEAIWWIASNYEHQQVSMTWLAYIPWFYQLLTIGTWVWEISFVFTVWNRWLRFPILLIGTAMHLGIGLFLGLWPFALIMIFGYVSFVPATILHQTINRISRKSDDTCDTEAESIDAATEDDFEPEILSKPTEVKEPPSEPNRFEPAIIKAPMISEDPPVLVNNISTESPPPRQRKKVRLMLAESDQDNLVLFIERSAKRRCSMIRALEDKGYRCIGLDAWPETIEVYNVLKPKSVMCNGYRMPTSELRFWRSQLDERADSNFIVLVEPQHAAQICAGEDRVTAIPIPASFEQICNALAGTDPSNDAGQQPFTRGSSSKDEDNGDQIFSMTS